ncbi:MAG TPA: sigma-70 family RNA polymerase sigma factor [Bacteroidales bacterium]|nr:sigma-70 family RNA polymerase sigma factor [Bacteroidales bacterium]
MNKELEDIIKACMAGDKNGQEALYKLFSGRMWAVCLRYAPDRDVAKDVFQDAFIKVFEKIRQFQFKGNFEGWMRKVFVNTAIACYRNKNTLTYELSPNLLPEENDDREELTDSDISRDELMKMIEELTPQYKMVFNLYAIEGFSHKEIASMLSISEGTSKSNLSRAREILKKKILTRLGTNIYAG